MMPELHFVIDDTYEKAARIEEILKKEANVKQD
jgi:ribosome-binding factor A